MSQSSTHSPKVTRLFQIPMRGNETEVRAKADTVQEVVSNPHEG